MPYSYYDFPRSRFREAGIETFDCDFSLHDYTWHMDIPYRKCGEKDLHLQILVPYRITGETQTFPTVVYVPGSGWREQKPKENVPWLVNLCERGYVVALVEYRTSDDAPFPAQTEDAAQALLFMKKYGARYSCDGQNFFFGGDSSGAHTALLAAYEAEQLRRAMKEQSAKKEGRVLGVMDLCGPTDLYRLHTQPTNEDVTSEDGIVGSLLGHINVLQNKEAAEKASVLAYTERTNDLLPTLIFHGDKDRIIPYQQSVMLYRTLKKKGVDCTMYRIRNADHGGPAFWCPEAINRMDHFFRRLIDQDEKNGREE